MVNQKADPQDFRNAVLKHQLKSTDQKQNEQNAKTAQVIYQNEYNEWKKKKQLPWVQIDPRQLAHLTCSRSHQVHKQRDGRERVKKRNGRSKRGSVCVLCAPPLRERSYQKTLRILFFGFFINHCRWRIFLPDVYSIIFFIALLTINFYLLTECIWKCYLGKWVNLNISTLAEMLTLLRIVNWFIHNYA